MASLSNQSKHTASITEQQYSDTGLTWDGATFTWDSPRAQSSTWDRQFTGITNQAENVATISNETKH